MATGGYLNRLAERWVNLRTLQTADSNIVRTLVNNRVFTADSFISVVTSGKIRFKGSTLSVSAESAAAIEVTSGKLNYKGSLLFTASSSILGGKAPSAQGGLVNNLIVSALSSYANDFTPIGFQINGAIPYSSAEPVIPTDVVLNTSSLPSAVTFSISAGNIAKNYLYDFYFRILLSQTAVVLNNILEDISVNIEIWNAYLTSNTLSTITETNAAELTLTLPFSIPYTFLALETQTASITIPKSGAASVDGKYSFAFATETPVVNLTGNRVTVWPFPPYINFREIRQWATDVIPARGGEQRFSNRELARTEIEGSYPLHNAEMVSIAKRIAHKLAHLPLAVPSWSNVVKVGALNFGTTVISINTTNIEIAENASILIFGSYQNKEIQEVLSMTSSSITLKSAITSTYPVAWVAPINVGYPINGINIDRSSNTEVKASFSIVDTNTFTSIAWPTSEVYKGLRVLQNKIVLSGGLSSRYERSMDVEEVMSGDIAKLDVENFNREYNTVSFVAKSSDEIYSLKRQFDHLKGKLIGFFLPSNYNDVTPLTAISIGAQSVTITYNGFFDFPIKYIRVVEGGLFENFQITSIFNNNNGTESLGFDLPATKNFTTAATIMLLTKVRLDTDTIEFNYINRNIMTVKCAVKEIL